MVCRLRIAAAVFFAMLAVALTGLWVRSHFYLDAASGPVGKWYFFPEVVQGIVHVEYTESARFVQVEKTWRFASFPITEIAPTESYSKHTTWGFGISPRTQGISLYFPVWLPTLIAASLAALFVFKRTWRFSLRTLLIVTTVVAAILGLAVYSI